MSEYRITRVDTGSLTAVECVYPSLEAAEAFLRSNWPDRFDQWALRRIVAWAENQPLPIEAWELTDDGDLVYSPLSEFYDHEFA